MYAGRFAASRVLGAKPIQNQPRTTEWEQTRFYPDSNQGHTETWSLLDLLKSLSDCRHETVERIMERRISGVLYVLDGFPQRDFVLWVFMCPTNKILCCFYSVSFRCLFCVYIPTTAPRATTPHLYRTGYHAFTTTARLSRLSLSRLPHHSSVLFLG